MMNINDYIVKELGALSLNNTIKEAQYICENYPISHVPVVENGRLIGNFAESDIRTVEKIGDEIKEHSFLFHNFYANEKATLLELISLFADNDCNLIPVLNRNNKYLGYYDLADILDVFANSPFLHRDSDTLVVEKNKNDFSMSQVAQIVESNKAKLLGLYISHESMDSVQVTLKINTLLMNEVIQTFRRYDFHVVTHHIDDEYLEQLKDRANYFNRYLDI